MWNWFTTSGKYTWIEVLPQLLKKYNNTVHRTISMKPKDVNINNEKRVLIQINKKRIQWNLVITASAVTSTRV